MLVIRQKLLNLNMDHKMDSVFWVVQNMVPISTLSRILIPIWAMNFNFDTTNNLSFFQMKVDHICAIFKRKISIDLAKKWVKFQTDIGPF